jgi:hypothetical protein
MDVTSARLSQRPKIKLLEVPLPLRTLPQTQGQYVFIEVYAVVQVDVFLREQPMANRLDQKEVVTLDELTLSNAWDLEALVEVLTAKGIITKREVLDMLTELRRRNPGAAAPNSALPADPNKADILVEHILNIFNSTGLTAQQAKDILTHLQVLVEIGERVAHGKMTY